MDEHLHVFGLTDNGKLWRTVLSIQGSADSWNPWEDIQANGAGDRGSFVSVDCAFLNTLRGSFLHVCGITADGKLWHTTPSQSGWEPFEDLTARLGGNWGEFLDVEITGVGDELHVCILAQTVDAEQRILHTIRHSDGTWDSLQDVNALQPVGSYIRIDCAGVGNDLHVCGVTDDGKLWHSMRSSQNNWTPFEDVGALSTNTVGSYTDVSITGSGTDLHIFAQIGGDLWHTIRSSNPASWQATFDNVKVLAGDPGSFSTVDCTAGSLDGGSGLVHVCGLTDNGELWHTIRFSDPLAWGEFQDVTSIIASAPGSFTVICITGNIIEEILFLLDVCTGSQNQVYNDCWVVFHSSNPLKASKKAHVQSLLVDPCSNLDVPPGCLP